jgi:hypothetical protein
MKVTVLRVTVMYTRQNGASFSSVIDGVGALDSESFEISRFLYCLELLQLSIETMGALPIPFGLIRCAEDSHALISIKLATRWVCH